MTLSTIYLATVIRGIWQTNCCLIKLQRCQAVVPSVTVTAYTIGIVVFSRFRHFENIHLKNNVRESCFCLWWESYFYGWLLGYFRNITDWFLPFQPVLPTCHIIWYTGFIFKSMILPSSRDLSPWYLLFIQSIHPRFTCVLTSSLCCGYWLW